MSYGPIRTKQCTVWVDDTMVAVDNGSGVLTGITGSGYTVNTGTVNYTSKAVSITFTGAPIAGKAIKCTYQFDTESDSSNIREVEIGLRIIPVMAKEHPLKISWSVPASFAASASAGLDVEDTLSVLAAQFIKTERDRYVVNYISRAAGNVDTELTFNCSVPGSGQQITKKQWYQDFKIMFSVAENKIFQSAGRGSVSWLIGGSNVAALIKQLDGFIPESNIIPIGAHVIGNIDGITIIKDPGMNANQYLCGYNGVLPGDAGIVLSEWIPIYFTPTITDSDLKGRKAVLSMYDVVTNMTQYYKKGSITNFNS